MPKKFGDFHFPEFIIDDPDDIDLVLRVPRLPEKFEKEDTPVEHDPALIEKYKAFLKECSNLPYEKIKLQATDLGLFEPIQPKFKYIKNKNKNSEE